MAGNLVFGSPGETIPPSFSSATAPVAAGHEVMAIETSLNAQPANWRTVWFNWWTDSDGPVPVERTPGNANRVEWGALFSGAGGTGYLGAASFAGSPSVTMADGGYAISDAMPAVPDGTRLRNVWNTPVGGARPADFYVNSASGDPIRVAASANLSVFDPAKTGNALTSYGGAPFSLEGLQPGAILVPFVAGSRILTVWGTSIEWKQDDSERYLASARYAYGYVAAGLESNVGGPRWGFINFGARGASIASQDDPTVTGKMQIRNGFLKDVLALNAGAWPMTDNLISFTNDMIAVADPGDAATMADAMKSIALAELAKFANLYPGVPNHVTTMAPRGLQELGYYCTDLVNQLPATGSNRPAAYRLFNAWLRSSGVAAGFASVLDAAASWAAPNDGSNYDKWRLTPFTIAGGGTVDATAHPSGLAVGLNLSTTGFTLAAAQAPEIGTYLVFEPGPTNAEVSQYQIVSATAAGTGLWLVKVGVGGALAKVHAAGSVVKTTNTTDRTHPGRWLHQTVGAERVAPWKASV